MQVNEVMTANPTCCIPSDTAQTAAIIMRDEDTGIVPIVERKGSRKLVGVITDRDLCLNVIAENLIAATENTGPANVAIEHYMTTKVITCRSDDDLDEVLELMKENQVRRIVVVEGQAIQGIVSLSDLMNRADVPSGKTRETLEGISKPTGEASKPRAESQTAR
jgi:CBS domain-containing protein